MNGKNARPRIKFVRELCKALPEDKQRQAEESFWAYLEIIRRVAAREVAIANVIHTHDSTEGDSDSTIQSPGVRETLHE